MDSNEKTELKKNTNQDLLSYLGKLLDRITNRDRLAGITQYSLTILVFTLSYFVFNKYLDIDYSLIKNEELLFVSFVTNVFCMILFSIILTWSIERKRRNNRRIPGRKKLGFGFLDIAMYGLPYFITFGLFSSILVYVEAGYWSVVWLEISILGHPQKSINCPQCVDNQ